jgi:acetyltransferase-like isoleucine patch superfamily enzyme
MQTAELKLTDLEERFPGVIFGNSCKVYPNVTIGEGSRIEDFCVIGMPPRGREAGELTTIIGKDAIIRPFTTIYAGNHIGDRFQSGQGTSIRENNVIGNDVSVGTNSVLEFDNRIGDRTRIHSLCFLEMVTLEEDVFIAPGVVFTDDPHPMCPKYKECLGGATVKAKARVGAQSTILPGVTIGKNALVGAGSLVAEDVAPESVVAGNPAKEVKKLEDLVCHPGIFEKPYVWEK